MNNFYQYNFEELKIFFKEHGLNPELAYTVFDKYYKDCEFNFKHIPKDFPDKISTLFDFELPKIVKTQTAADGTIKFLIEFKDNNRVETVLIPFFKKYTVCLSSQVGCAMNCSFCFTGTQGFKRNLEANEIVGQYLVAFNYLKAKVDQKSIKPNIVFMGQGEPLHNFINLKKSIEILCDKHGLHLGNRQITVSSAGLIPGLKDFQQLHHINLAISFHSAKNEIRNELIPLNKKYPIEQLIETLKTIPLIKRQFLTIEYLLIDGLNDSKEDAQLLAETLSPLKSIVNLIPFNPFPGSKYQRPSNEKVELFKTWLVEQRVRVMVRTTKGDDILAACGQLNTK